MQAVILAAGRGTRMGSLTDVVPKPMLTVAGKTLIEHKLDILPDEVDEIIIVIGYRGNVIRERFGDSFARKRISYAAYEEDEPLDGTAGAVWKARPYLSDRFLILMGDDLNCREDMEVCMSTPDWTMVVESTQRMGAGGRVITNEAGIVTGIEEGDHRGKPGRMNTNVFLLDERFFSMPPVPKAAGSAEYGLPQTVVAIAAADGIPLAAIETSGWIQITAPEDLTDAEARLAMLG